LTRSVGTGRSTTAAISGYGAAGSASSILEIHAIGTGDFHNFVFSNWLDSKDEVRPFGTSGANTITRTDVYDINEGGAGADTLNGWTGNDMLSYAGSSAAVVVNLDTGSASGGDAQGDTFTSFRDLCGSANGDNLTGSSVANRIEGGAGNDFIDGGAGRDSLFGEAGDDRLVVRSGDDTASETYDGGADTDILEVIDSAANETFSFIDDTVRSIETFRFGSASGGADRTAIFSASQVGGTGLSGTLLIDGNSVTGHTETFRIEMGAKSTLDISGFTLIDWGGQDDIVEIVGDASNETITGSSVNDVITGGVGTDVLRGGDGADSILGEADADIIAGDNGNDTLSGGDGADTMFGGNDNYDMNGDTGDDNLNGGLGDDTLRGGDGADSIVGDAGDDSLNGGTGNDILRGGDNEDRLDGGSGNDTLAGNDGDYILNGGSGTDLLFGGAGDEVFVFAAVSDSPHGNGRDTIGDSRTGLT